MCDVAWSPLPPPGPTPLLVVIVGPDGLPGLNSRFGPELAGALELAEFKAKGGESFRFSISDGGFCQVLLLGTEETSPADLRVLAYEAGRAGFASGVPSMVLDLRAAGPADAHSTSLVSEGLLLAGYAYETYIAPDKREKRKLEQVTVIAEVNEASARAGVERAEIVASAISRARDLGNGPAELVTPSHLADSATEMVAELARAGHDVSCEVLDLEACEARGMGLYLAVARGSDEPPKFLHLTYRPKNTPSRGRVCLIGKGVTFDSGGYSLKPSDGMMGMKLDMAGAAAVIGAFEGLTRLEVPYEVHVISAAAENMVNGGAYKLGDVFRASNGKTVEINNTDAEGRLTLADALVFAAGLEPDLVIDFATLTGACIVALGPHICGVMTRDDALAQAWLDAGTQVGEQMWRLPLPKPLMRMLDSKIADLRNTGERAGGASTAGLFLEQFTEGTRWMHVDIAGPAIVDKPFGVNREGSSGVPVATILHFLSSDLPN